MNLTQGEAKGITSAEMLFFPVGVLQRLDKNKSFLEISLLQPAQRYLDGVHEKTWSYLKNHLHVVFTSSDIILAHKVSHALL